MPACLRVALCVVALCLSAALPALAGETAKPSVGQQLEGVLFWPQAERDAQFRRIDALLRELGPEDTAFLLDSFATDVASLLSDLSAALERGDAELAKRSLHTLKGASANVGFDDLSRQAAALMTELPDPDVGALGKLMMTIAGAGSVVAGLKAEFVKTSETNEAEAVQ